MANTDINVASFRDEILGYIGADYQKKVLEDPKNKATIDKLKTRPIKELYNEAKKIYDLFKTNQIPDEDLEKQKLKLTLLLSAIVDYELLSERFQRYKNPDRDNDGR